MLVKYRIAISIFSVFAETFAPFTHFIKSEVRAAVGHNNGGGNPRHGDSLAVRQLFCIYCFLVLGKLRIAKIYSALSIGIITYVFVGFKFMIIYIRIIPVGIFVSAKSGGGGFAVFPCFVSGKSFYIIVFNVIAYRLFVFPGNVALFTIFFSIIISEFVTVAVVFFVA